MRIQVLVKTAIGIGPHRHEVLTSLLTSLNKPKLVIGVHLLEL